MKIEVLAVGKTDDKYIDEGIRRYAERIKHYVPFELKTIPDIKNVRNMSEEQQKRLEGQAIMSELTTADVVALLDEKGRELTSREFADFCSKTALSGAKRLIFVIGGPYGFSDEVYARANHKISLSRMTFPHQLVRLIFAEQLYRAQTIIKGEPYHHD